MDRMVIMLSYIHTPDQVSTPYLTRSIHSTSPWCKEIFRVYKKRTHLIINKLLPLLLPLRLRHPDGRDHVQLRQVQLLLRVLPLLGLLQLLRRRGRLVLDLLGGRALDLFRAGLGDAGGLGGEDGFGLAARFALVFGGGLFRGASVGRHCVCLCVYIGLSSGGEVRIIAKVMAMLWPVGEILWRRGIESGFPLNFGFGEGR